MAGTFGAADAARLTDFARTLKAACTIVLYPDRHAAVRSSLARLVDLTSRDRLPIADGHGVRLPAPVDVNLREPAAKRTPPPAMVAPIGPSTIGIDPLTLL
jgi:hypothetical protein